MNFEDLFSDVDSIIINTYPTTFQLKVGEEFQEFQGVFKDNYEEFDVEKGQKVFNAVPNLRIQLSAFPANTIVFDNEVTIKSKSYRIREVKPDSYVMARVTLREVR